MNFADIERGLGELGQKVSAENLFECVIHVAYKYYYCSIILRLTGLKACSTQPYPQLSAVYFVVV